MQDPKDISDSIAHARQQWFAEQKQMCGIWHRWKIGDGGGHNKRHRSAGDMARGDGRIAHDAR
eukprot:1826624-Prymnesium_polylepis.1